MEKIFELALRSRMRFNFKGVLTVEDLFSLRAEDLNDFYISLSRQKKDTSVEGLIKVESRKDKELAIQMEIVKYIYSVKDAENKERVKVNAKKIKREKILSTIADKEVTQYKEKSIDELKAMAEELK